jgi:Fe-S oxidoreductase
VDKQWHLFSVYRHLNGVSYPEFFHLKDVQAGQVDTLFFPGCTLVSYASELVLATGKWLSDKGYKWAISEDCCGSPLNSRGLYERFDNLQSKLVDRCREAKISRIITVCAGCELELTRSLEKFAENGVTVVSLPKLLQEHGETISADNEPVMFFDSCHDRKQTHGAPLRELFAGNATCKFACEGRDTLCCGAGGAVSSFDAEIVGKRAKRILDEVGEARAKTLISSCPTCAFTFAYQQIYGNLSPELQAIKNKHYLELLYGIDIDWRDVFARAEQMWAGEHSAWVMSQLL